jgi:MraZ protein
MFRGRHDHTLDKKGRISIPSGFRVEIQRRSENPPILTNYRDHLALHPADEWEVTERELMDMSNLQPDVQDYRRFVISGAVECPIDNQGRILIPAYLRAHAGLETKVIIAGVLDRIEIWNPKRFDANQKTTLLRLGEIQKSVDESRRPQGA